MKLGDFFIVDAWTGAAVYNTDKYWNVWTKMEHILSAEIDIAAQATVLRKDKDDQLTGMKDRISVN